LDLLILGLDLDPDPHSSKSLDPDPHIMNADPKQFFLLRFPNHTYGTIRYGKGKCVQIFKLLSELSICA
jgi:hypothetical protein